MNNSILTSAFPPPQISVDPSFVFLVSTSLAVFWPPQKGNLDGWIMDWRRDNPWEEGQNWLILLSPTVNYPPGGRTGTSQPADDRMDGRAAGWQQFFQPAVNGRVRWPIFWLTLLPFQVKNLQKKIFLAVPNLLVVKFPQKYCVCAFWRQWNPKNPKIGASKCALGAFGWK